MQNFKKLYNVHSFFVKNIYVNIFKLKNKKY